MACLHDFKNDWQWMTNMSCDPCKFGWLLFPTDDCFVHCATTGLTGCVDCGIKLEIPVSVTCKIHQSLDCPHTAFPDNDVAVVDRFLHSGPQRKFATRRAEMTHDILRNGFIFVTDHQ